MLNINYLNIDLDRARKEHLNFFICYVTKRLLNHECETSDLNKVHPVDRPKYCNSIKRRQLKYINSNLIQDFINDENNLEKILIGTPKELNDINEIFIEKVDSEFGLNAYKSYVNLSENERVNKGGDIHDFFLDVNAIFNYACLSNDKYDYNSYKLTSNLGVRSCIYCNRSYAITLRKNNNGRLMNPQLDHWFPKSTFPLLQVSFHNLIPCCDICNSRVKNSIEFDVNSDSHPYQDDQDDLFFTYFYDSSINNFRVIFSKDSNPRIKLTSEKMFIDQMYNGHLPELNDLLLTKQAYSENYLTSLKKAFPLMNLNELEIYRLAFGVELNQLDFHKRPLSKFKNDILRELGIIKY